MAPHKRSRGDDEDEVVEASSSLRPDGVSRKFIDIKTQNP